jgi:hypothetical protein
MSEEQLKAAQADEAEQEVAEEQISEDDLEGVAGGTNAYDVYLSRANLT